MASSRNNILEFSSAGSTIVDSSSGATSREVGAIQFLKDSTISALTAPNSSQGRVTDASKLLTTFTAGTILYGSFTSVTISSGLIAVHNV